MCLNTSGVLTNDVMKMYDGYNAPKMYTNHVQTHFETILTKSKNKDNEKIKTTFKASKQTGFFHEILV